MKYWNFGMLQLQFWFSSILVPGITNTYGKLLNKEWNPMKNQSQKKLGCQQGKLINFVPTSLPMFFWRLNLIWFLRNRVILKKHNLAKRNWNGCRKCAILWLSWVYHSFILLMFFCMFYINGGSFYFQYNTSGQWHKYVW
jgi:hypothetical protein